MEHSGQPKLAMIRDTRCLSCHGDLRRHVTGAAPPVAAHIRGFGIEHPEFQPIADPATLRFSHRKHLKSTGIATADDKREVLTCASCHKLVSQGAIIDPAPLDFNRACHRCHQLTFDDALLSTEVPHGGDPNTVYGESQDGNLIRNDLRTGQTKNVRPVYPREANADVSKQPAACRQDKKVQSPHSGSLLKRLADARDDHDGGQRDDGENDTNDR